jgi:hypothetical protein
MFRPSFGHDPAPAFPQGTGDIFSHRSGRQALLQACQEPVASQPRFFMGSGQGHQASLAYLAHSNTDSFFVVAVVIDFEL